MIPAVQVVKLKFQRFRHSSKVTQVHLNTTTNGDLKSGLCSVAQARQELTLFFFLIY